MRTRPRRRGPAVLDLREPPLAVWAGEVVALAGPRRRELLTVLQVARAHGNGRIVTALVAPAWGAPESAANRLVARVGPARGLVVAIALVPDTPGRRVLAALQRAVAARVPCRCLWLVDGRVYPE